MVRCFVTFQASVRALQRGNDAIARGDLGYRDEVCGRDELARIGHTLDASADGSKRELAGRPASAVPGLDTPLFLARVWATTRSGSGWIPYDEGNPSTRVIVPKAPYILPLGGSDFVG